MLYNSGEKLLFYLKKMWALLTKKEEEDLVEVTVFANLAEANIAKGLLESSGITAFVFYDSSCRGGSLSDRIRLMVTSTDKEEACRLLSHYQGLEEKL